MKNFQNHTHHEKIFPKIPTWDFINTIQIISPVDNPNNEGMYGKTNNHLGRFTRWHSKNSQEQKLESDRELIWISWIMHRNPFAALDLVNAFHSKYNAVFTHFDNPKQTYDTEILSSQIIDYLEQIISQNPNKKFIIFGVSLGEVLSRKLYEKLNKEEHKHLLNHIDHHFSICGVANHEELCMGVKWIIPILKTRIWKILAKNLADYVHKNIPEKNFQNSKNTQKIQQIFANNIFQKIIGGLFFSPTGGTFDKKLQKDWENFHKKTTKNIWNHLSNTHRKRGAKSMTEAHFDMFVTMWNLKKEATKNKDIQLPKATIIYSNNDPVFKNSENNAIVGSDFYNNPELFKINEWNHVDVIYQSEKYLQGILPIIDQYWKNDH